MSKYPGKRKMGWLPDFPDLRDYTVERKEPPSNGVPADEAVSVNGMLRQVGAFASAKSKKSAKLPVRVDLREWCSAVEDQGEIGSCTAHAGVSLIEYFERRAFGRHIDASRRFLYKVTRNLMRLTGDTGAYCRTTMGAIALFGVPPEEYWPYDIENFDEEPPAFCYAFAQNYRAIQYYRLDPAGVSRPELLAQIKLNLHSGLPLMFGFTVYNSIEQSWEMDGKIPFPSRTDKTTGGHAVMAVGYDDELEIQHNGSEKTTGAILIRNSWGPTWGEEGYGWLPYDFVLSGIAIDWWSLLKKDWVDTDRFGSE
jgi:C1A family cysteine protease